MPPGSVLPGKFPPEAIVGCQAVEGSRVKLKVAQRARTHGSSGSPKSSRWSWWLWEEVASWVWQGHIASTVMRQLRGSVQSSYLKSWQRLRWIWHEQGWSHWVSWAARFRDTMLCCCQAGEMFVLHPWLFCGRTKHIWRKGWCALQSWCGWPTLQPACQEFARQYNSIQVASPDSDSPQECIHHMQHEGQWVSKI